MADERREHEYDVAIQHACYISQVFAGSFDPMHSNPVAIERTKQLQMVQSDGRGKEAFDLLGAGLRRIAMDYRHGNG